MNLRHVLPSVLVAFGVTAGAIDTSNLVVNGACETGAGKQADGWGQLDGIAAMWSPNGGKPGGCLRLDTSVLQVDKKKFTEAAGKPPPRSKGGQYDTVGAHEGAWSFSQPVKVATGDQYFIVEADVKGPERSTQLFYPQVFIRGYQKFKEDRDAGTMAFFVTPHTSGPDYSEQFGKEQRAAHEGDFLMVYRHSLVCRVEAPDQWQHYQLGIRLPTIPKYRPDVLVVKPYAMWPLGVYTFDNIVLRKATKAEVEEVNRKGHSIEGFMPTE
jgi:hypothetical protein